MSTELLYIDLFCGAGGTSTGVERARIDGRKCARVIACVNHDANAILSHAANHPHTRHFTEDIRTFDLGPLKVHTAVERMKNPDAKVVLWASIECTNHSRAKGGMSRDADSRTLAEHLFRYFGLFARVGLPMVWPQPTHARKPAADLFGGSLKPWRAVRDVLDFDDRGESIFTRRKPLVDATLDRIHAGLVKFVAEGQDAFLVKWNSVNGKTGKYIAPDLDAPCPTVATQNRLGVARVNFLSKQFGGAPQSKNIGVDGPAGTLTTVDHHAFVSAYYGNGYNSSIDNPAPTLMTKDRFQVVRPFFEGHCIAWAVRADDTPAMRRIKEFCALYGIVDITMRMLRISEMKRIQGFGDDYVLVGTQEEQKKYLGNAVVTQVATAMCEALAGAIDNNMENRKLS